MLVVLVGGARAGKSRLADELGRRSGERVVYVATCPRIPGDDELAERIDRHRLDRPVTWTTVEEELDLAGAIERSGDAFVVVDCLTLWVNNLLHHGYSDDDVRAACDAALAAVRRRAATTVAVTNEVGLGVVPADELSRRYRDQLGLVNQRWVGAADRSMLVVAGRALPLHDPHELLASTRLDGTPPTTT